MSKHRAEATPPPAHGFRRLIAVAKVGESGLVQKVAAGANDFSRIASYLDLARIDALSAEMTLTRWRAKGIRVSGKLKAVVTQTCVVTLDPLPARIEAEFERRFLPAETPAKGHADQRDVIVDPEGEDPPEPLDRDIDLGELLIEELALSLDPYPRKPDVEFRAGEEPASEPRKNPFAALAKLKSKKT
jgi:uncharacterized metal-binding protein YceD (DUF177 family)